MKVFLQYSWDSEPHKQWVLDLADRLISDGVDLYFDRYDLRVGSNNLHFMERIELSQKVILIMSGGYKAKADTRSGGIGYEYQIMSSEIAAELTTTQKFIPVLRNGDATTSIPRLLQQFLYLDMRDDNYFEQHYLELLHLIFDEPFIKRPKLGNRPLLGKMLEAAQDLDRGIQLKTSRRVHDVVANSLYKLLGEIEDRVDIDREDLLDKLENLYQRSRDIAYKKPEATKFHESISELLSSFADKTTNILIVGNLKSFWEKIDEQKQYELKHVIQELMVNMKKHSNATQVIWRFESTANHMKIFYSDNGVGIEKDRKINMGLKNVGNRIDLIDGEIDFSSEKGEGLKILISFPFR